MRHDPATVARWRADVAAMRESLFRDNARQPQSRAAEVTGIWSIEEERELRDMAEFGRDVRAIAAALGRSEESVRRKACRIGVKPAFREYNRPFSDLEERDICRMRADGLSWRQIATALNRSTAGVWKRYQKIQARQPAQDEPTCRRES